MENDLARDAIQVKQHKKQKTEARHDVKRCGDVANDESGLKARSVNVFL